MLAIPFQLVEEMRWWSIPVVSVASFAIIGILGIGAEIENPFGYDDNDLVRITYLIKSISYFTFPANLISYVWIYSLSIPFARKSLMKFA